MSEQTHQFDDPVAQEVWNTLRALNDAWTKGNPDDLQHYFHERMMALTPVAHERHDDGATCIANWKGFAQTAKIIDWCETDPNVQVYGNAAVVAYYFDMHFELAGQPVHSTGRDLAFFVKEDGRWQMVGDQFSPYPF